MSDERRQGGSEPLERNTSGMIVQGAAAFGEATGGLGALALGVAKLKETFGGGGQAPDQNPPPSGQPSDQDPT